ncbi:class I histocompatibility antigen, F10 alpha chain-like [Acanthopagrus latus]|uniref:class I histocompatibility antigen, F10 alpha chain-like n=1 Tax=Acanthopagrus latus TaxID=8177 RepID=UPI00187C6DF7|nr:class I histocompatibility antigen, F10 alpha chain-like [Acanthopagrus latus]
MRTLLLLLLFCHVSSAVLHSMKFFITSSTGIPNIPDVVVTLEIDELLLGYCDSNKTIDLKLDFAKSYCTENPEQLEWYKQMCFHFLPTSIKAYTNILSHFFHQTGGDHVVQVLGGCEWDDETEEVKGFAQIGYDGEDFKEFDPNTSRWIAQRPEAFPAKLLLDANKELGIKIKTVLTQTFPEHMKTYVKYGRSALLRTELPSVSLLQKTPSSPVSCLATGFYPHRASLVWRKDGEELHEEVDHGEILPNQDGTFQMRVDLNLSSVTPEDWTRYDCVFQLAGVKKDIITRLEKDRIRTNELKPSNMTVLVTAAVVVLSLILIGAAGFIVYKKKKAISPPSAPDNSAELSEQLNPET